LRKASCRGWSQSADCSRRSTTDAAPVAAADDDKDEDADVGSNDAAVRSIAVVILLQL